MVVFFNFMVGVLLFIPLIILFLSAFWGKPVAHEGPPVLISSSDPGISTGRKNRPVLVLCGQTPLSHLK